MLGIVWYATYMYLFEKATHWLSRIFKTSEIQENEVCRFFDNYRTLSVYSVCATTALKLSIPSQVEPIIFTSRMHLLFFINSRVVIVPKSIAVFIGKFSLSKHFHKRKNEKMKKLAKEQLKRA